VLKVACTWAFFGEGIVRTWRNHDHGIRAGQIALNQAGASNLANEAKNRVGQTTDTIKEAVADGKDAGADYVSSLAETIRRAAGKFDNDLPHSRKLFAKLHRRSRPSRARCARLTADLKASIRNVRSFARRQPIAFLGITALAGFATVSVLKSSSGPDLSASSHGSPPAGTRYLDN
jgi:hypothetical protein